MSKKRVLIIAANGLGKTGVPKVIMNVALTLIERFEVDIAVFNDENYYENELRKLNIGLIHVKINEPKKMFSKLLWRLFFEKKKTVAVFKMIFKQNQYCAIHSFREFESAYIFQAAKDFGIEKIILHCNNELKKPNKRISNYFREKKYNLIRKYCTNLIGVSSKCCNVSYPDIEPTIIYNPIDENMFSLKPYQTSDQKMVLCQVGTFSTRKNQLFTLKVLSEIAKTLDVVLYLVGVEAEKGYLVRIKESIDALGISSSVSIVDGVNDFTNILKKTTFFVLPSLSEGAPLVLVEAQSCGIMCFSSANVTREVDCGGVRFIEGFNESEWANQLIKSFKDTKIFRNKYDISKFSFSSFREALMNVYEQTF